MLVHGDWMTRDDGSMPKDCASADVIVFSVAGLQQKSEVDMERDIVCVTTSPNSGATPPGHVAPAGHARQVPFVRDVFTVSK